MRLERPPTASRRLSCSALGVARPWVLLFDLDGVLCRYDRRARVAALARTSGKSSEFVERAIWGSGFEDLGDAGAFDAEAYLSGFGERLGYPLSYEEWLAAQRAAIAPCPQALALAESLRQSYTLAVLTNNNLLVLRAMDGYLPGLRPVFGERIFVSAQFCARKPDPNVYRRCVEQLGVAPETTLFVDDSAKNVAGGVAAGLGGCRYTGVESLRAALCS